MTDEDPSPEVSEIVAGTDKPKTATPRPKPSGLKKKHPTGRLTSYDIFEVCIERAQNLIQIHFDAHGKATRPESYLSDAFRASVVLSISALDAFVRTHVLEQITAILQDKAKSLPAHLSSEIRKFVKEEELLEAARKDDLAHRVEKAFSQDFEKKSFQGVKNITEALKLLGKNDVFHDIAIAASKNEDTLKKEITEFTQRRHCIAHQGDYDLNRTPAETRSITKADAEKCIRLVKLLAKQLKDIKP